MNQNEVTEAVQLFLITVALVTVVTVVYCAVKLLTLPAPEVLEASQIRCLMRVTVTI